jgi:hypothetical protein
MLPLPNGRQGVQLLMTRTRDLTQGDLLLLATQPAPERRSPAPTIQVLRATHHQAARLIARGLSYQQVAREVGRTSQRISDLMRDPTFQELVVYYEKQVEETVLEESIEFGGIVKDVARLALEEIQERLDDPVKRSQIPVGELRQLAGDALSRTVLPQKTAVPVTQAPVKITFNMGNRDLRFHDAERSDILDIDSNEQADGFGEPAEAPSESKDNDLQDSNSLPEPREAS